MILTPEKETQIRQEVEAIEDQESAAVQNGDLTRQSPHWAPDMIVNAPDNHVLRIAEVIERMRQQTTLQYYHFERHREATIVRRNCAVTMGYEIVVPKGNTPQSGKTINRRYTNIYYFEDGAWRAIARQATNISVD
jgi:hypothetical protein